VTTAALASSGAGVLVVCADALRRRELVEGAVRPARFGGGEVAIASARLPASCRERAASANVILADWAALEGDSDLASGRDHVVIVDPPAFPDAIAAVAAGAGYLHDLSGPVEAEFALRVHRDEWPSRASLAALYRDLRDGGTGQELAAAPARAALCGVARSYPLRPEVAARSARVLAELGLLAWAGSGTTRTLRVVSSEGTDLEQSRAFVAYRRVCEEGARFLSERRQS
jgi:hypothetical protein